MPFRRIINVMKYKIFLGVMLLLTVITFTLTNRPDTDLEWQIKAGSVLVEEKTFHSNDLYSFTAGGLPWNNHEWLWCLAVYLIYKISGFAGLNFFKALLVGLSFFLVYLTASRRYNYLISFIVLITLFFISPGRFFFTARAHLITYLFIALTLYLLENYQNSKGLCFYLLPFLFWLWSNLHGGFVLGEAILIFYYLFKIRNKDFFFICFISLITPLINPSGVSAYTFPASHLKSTFHTAVQTEWLPAFMFGYWVSLTTAACLTVFFFLINFKDNLRLIDLILFSSFLFLAFKSIRNIPLFYLIDSFILSRYISLTIEKRLKFPGIIKLKNLFLVRFEKVLTASILILILPVFIYKINKNDLYNSNIYNIYPPKEAVAFMMHNGLPQNFYNPYEWGGYLIWKLYPKYKVFIDGRATMLFPDKIYKDAFLIRKGISYKKLLNEYNVSMVLSNLSPDYPQGLNKKLSSDPLWEEIYKDDKSIIFIRKKMKAKEYCYPASAYSCNQEAISLISRGKYDLAKEKLLKAIELDEFHALSYLWLGYIEAINENYNKAEFYFKRAVYLNPYIGSAHYNLGKIYEKKGLLKKAVFEYKKELKSNPEFTDAKNSLNEIYKLLKY